MLVLGRKEQEEILIGPDIIVRVCEIKRGYVRIGITAPFEIRIHRRELVEPEEELGGES